MPIQLVEEAEDNPEVFDMTFTLFQENKWFFKRQEYCKSGLRALHKVHFKLPKVN